VHNAYGVSFKLETEEAILQKKAKNAMIKYGVDMVICNLLHTRHDVVSALTSKTNNNTPPQEEQGNDVRYEFEEIRKRATVNNPDDLEDRIISFVASSHFEYIAENGCIPGLLNDMSSTILEQKSEQRRNRKIQIRKELAWKYFKEVATHVSWGLASYWISIMIKKRLDLNNRS